MRIDLAFDGKSMKPFLNVRYTEKLDNIKDDVMVKMQEFLPPDDFIKSDEAAWVDSIESENFDIGQEYVCHSYTLDGDDYDIYKLSVLDGVGSKLLKRMQILALLYIEGASYIEPDERWNLYVTYKRNGGLVSFVTTYKYWLLRENRNGEWMYRGRISQVVVMPHMQGKGHGSKIYEAIREEWVSDNKCFEFGVEDPNESFEKLRDVSDMSCGEHDVGLMKFSKRQGDKIREMRLLERGEEDAFRLAVKKRVYRANKEALEELSLEEVKEKLIDPYERNKAYVLEVLEEVKKVKARNAKRGNVSE